MIEINVNYLAVLVAGVNNMVIGFLWFGPVFGKQWMALMDFTNADIEAGKKKGMGKTYAMAFVGSLIMAYVLSYVITLSAAYFQTSGISPGLSSAFWMWLGFIVPLTLSSVLWEGKSWKLWIINSGYWLTALLAMGIILSLWM